MAFYHGVYTQSAILEAENNERLGKHNHVTRFSLPSGTTCLVGSAGGASRDRKVTERRFI